jgi:uncharacterized protein YbaR (Trm112 family)/ubiquinone/menaquinone biosynthesis C-methylase UbiE
VNAEILAHLCCPDCRGGLQEHAGALECSACGRTYEVRDGIPVLLPSRLPNPDELEVRRKVSEEVTGSAALRERYARHHFARLAQLRLERTLRPGSRVLDVGIGWGVVWLPFRESIDLWGIDFSFESLVAAREIYRSEGLEPPRLICASLDAIPIRDLRFDLVQSTQVYQHIPSREAIVDSFRQILDGLLASDGSFVVENLNYAYARTAAALRARVRRSAPRFERERTSGDYHLRYWDEDDVRSLVSDAGGGRVEVVHTESLFHPELRFRPRSRALARADDALSRTPVARRLARQLTAVTSR